MGTEPISLVGNNLGERHRHLNNLINEAENISFQDVEAVALNRIFQIDVASKQKNVEFIIENLKDDDMLYVSRALKATWLMDNEYRNIINPNYLERVIFSEMLTTAISKMKHWLYINLGDPERCAEFYNYYKQNHFNFAIKFLCRCDNQVILNEYPKILTKITPHYLKIFSEKCSLLAKKFFEAIASDPDVTAIYLENERLYLESIKSVLKVDPDVYFHIIEKYYNINKAKKLSPIATKYIISQHKDRYLDKQELYTAWLLHIPTLAKFLTAQECEEAIIKLAKAKYLASWFSYKAVEPLIKRISPNSRAAFKRRIFVDKDFGDYVEEWPYPIPESPPANEAPGKHVFEDLQYTSREFEIIRILKRVIKKKKGPKYECCEILEDCYREKTEMDRLFDEFRFVGFDRTFYELSKRIRAVSSMESRRNIFMVLISKSGGRHECVALLLQLMEKHINEPANFRAAVVRSLVKRAQVWRLPAESWSLLLKFSYHLGLDGNNAEEQCTEGLHAVVLREFLLQNDLEPNLRRAFLENFSTLREYSLTVTESTLVFAGLTKTLTITAEAPVPQEVYSNLMSLFDVYSDYKVRLTHESPMIPAVKKLLQSDSNLAEHILKRLYFSRIARKELFLENLIFLQCDEAYVNILRHDIKAIAMENLIDNVLKDRKSLNQFMRKLYIYFGEKNGLSEKVLAALIDKIKSTPHIKLARPVATLIGKDFVPLMQTLDEDKDDILKKCVTAALRANAHCVRPKIKVEDFDMSSLGAKAVTNRHIVCRSIDVEKYVNKLVLWRHTVRTALVLAQRTSQETAFYPIAAKMRPKVVVKQALKYFKRSGDNADITVWDLIKPIIRTLDLVAKDRMRRTLLCVSDIPANIRPDYCATLYLQLRKISEGNAVHSLQRDLENMMPAISPEVIEEILMTMLSKHNENSNSVLYPNFFIKYLLLGKTEQEQKRRLLTVGTQFFKTIESINEHSKIPYHLYFERILKCLKCSVIFFDSQYVSPLPVIETTQSLLAEEFMIETNFGNVAEVRLTTLYYEAVRQSVKEFPQMYTDINNVNDEGVEIVGKQFGRNVAKDLNELTTNYFDSIIELFKVTFLNYLDNYFPAGSSKTRFIEAVMRGILEANIGKQARVVTHYIKNRRKSSMQYQELKSQLANKDIETRFFIYAD